MDQSVPHTISGGSSPILLVPLEAFSGIAASFSVHFNDKVFLPSITGQAAWSICMSENPAGLMLCHITAEPLSGLRKKQ